jgi:endonuclease/exonuclease/phosphatase family metal-dependent hydrolase/DUF971 family protein
MRYLLAILALSLSIQGCASSSDDKKTINKPEKRTAESKSIQIMAYNVENLFDTLHDEGTEDWTYLPLKFKQSSPVVQDYCKTLTNAYYRGQCFNYDWSDEVLAKKITNISKVILSYGNNGPDILVLEEVENLNVINILADNGLKDSGYISRVLIEGDDTRGISVAVLSKYPVLSAKHHSIYLNDKKLDTRGITQVTLDVAGKKVVVFANHWPSQSNPTAQRLANAQVLADAAELEKDATIVAMGDFNTLETEKPHPFSLLSNFVDAEVEARKIGTQLNAGTHFYKGEWSSLDRIFVHKNNAAKQQWNTFNILLQPWMMEDVKGKSAPKGYDPKTGEGFADHLPLTMELYL